MPFIGQNMNLLRRPKVACLLPIAVFLLSSLLLCSTQGQTAPFDLTVKQITSGKKHHIFGYIGQCRTIPWNASGRYILGLELDFIDRMPKPEDAATVFVVDTQKNNRIIRLDKTHGWNPQQGTMFYWNPNNAEHQFFFNDRDVDTGQVYTVLYDVQKRKRVREYRFDDASIGNGGVAFDGPGLVGHSDADAVAHAVIDALLGAASLGDIGQRYPDTDPAHAGADSMALLVDTVAAVASEGWEVANVDCTVVLEFPRLAPRRDDMRDALSAAVGAPVSVKGRRAEGLGAIGRQEGVACFAVALLQRDGGRS